MQRVDGHVAVVLCDDPLRALLELLLVGRRPPTLEVALLVELAALVIEAVRDLVADRAPRGVAVDQRVVDQGVGDAGQDEGGRRQHDLVVRRVVVGIVSLRRHLPLGAIDRLVELGDVVVALPFVAADRVPQERIALHLVVRVVLPLHRIADLLGHRVQLLERPLLGGRAHPVEVPDPRAEGVEDIVGQLLVARLRLG